jgi:hypothetical protein
MHDPRVPAVSSIGMSGAAGILARCDAQARPSRNTTAQRIIAPDARTLRGAPVITTAQAAAHLASGKRGLSSMSCRMFARPANLPAGTHLAREAAAATFPADSGWPTRATASSRPHGGLSARRPGAHHRRRSRQAPGDLLPQGLLDVMERRQARRFRGATPTSPGIPTAPTAGRTPDFRSARRLRRRNPANELYSSACWIARASANRRCSIRTGTSQT